MIVLDAGAPRSKPTKTEVNVNVFDGSVGAACGPKLANSRNGCRQNAQIICPSNYWLLIVELDSKCKHAVPC